MKCFNHPNVDAVAVCKSCGRALCHGCVAQVGPSCSCRGECEAVVAAMDELVQRGRSAYLKSSATQMRSGVVIVLLGGLFLVVGVATWSGERTGWNFFLMGAGALFTVLGLSSVYSGIRFRQK